MQSVTKDHKELLLQSIRSILNEEVEEHSKELETIKEILVDVNIDLDYLRKYENDKIIVFMKNINKYNELIKEIRDEIDNKLDNPFDPINLENRVGSIIEILGIQYEELIAFIDEFNSSISLREDTQKYLEDLNKRIARIEIDDNYRLWLSLRQGLNTERLKLVETTKKIEELKEDIKILNSEKSRVDIALKDINGNLNQIFSGRNRLSLELDENSNYRIMTRGKRVKLKKLSTGERNVISLCYFFSHLRNNTSSIKMFSDSYFIILDDPISSLDFDNKIGIYSYLRKTFKDILCNNQKSRILILTHDLEVVYKLDKVFDDIKKEKQIEKFSCSMRLLLNKCTKSVNISKINNYAWNIEEIYEYATSDIDDYSHKDYNIGNVLRKTLEAYATFNFRIGISDLTNSEEILNKIKNNDLREHFKNRMFRLLLNSESHTEEIAKTFTDHDLFEQFSKEERIQLSKDVLCLLYLLDKEHIKSYLPNNDKEIKNIESWIKQHENSFD